MKNEYDIILIILYIIPVYFTLKGILYRIGIKLAGEDKVYKDPELLKSTKYLDKIGLLPDPKFSKSEKMEWSKYWYVHIIIGFILTYVIFITIEWSLISKMILWINSP